MNEKKLNILVIIGSASENSLNEKLIMQTIQTNENINVEIFNTLKDLPHFDTVLTNTDTPPPIETIRNKIEIADGVIFCTPEYIFSIPSGLKNLFEWCVSMMVFNNKPVSIITASTSGEKCHEEMKLILETLGANVRNDNNVLIKAIKAKFKDDGRVDDQTQAEVKKAIHNFLQQILKNDFS